MNFTERLGDRLLSNTRSDRVRDVAALTRRSVRSKRALFRAEGMTYNRFINGLKNAGVEVDRKILAELAVSDSAAFAQLVQVAKDNQSQAAA